MKPLDVRDSLERPPASLARHLSLLFATNGVGSLLNVAKFVTLPVVFLAGELDLLTVGLLAAVTLSQIVGEAISQHAVVAPPRRRPDRNDLLAGSLIGLFVLAATFPRPAAAMIAPGLSPNVLSHASLSTFFLAGAASVVLWWLAGECQRHMSFVGVHLLNMVPNACIVFSALLPDPSVEKTAGVMLAGITIAALITAIHRGRLGPPRGAPVPSAKARALSIFLILSISTQLNLVLLRVFASDLPPGTLGGLYVAAGVVLVPTLVIANSFTAATLPRWTKSRHDNSTSPYWTALLAAVLTAGMTAIAVGGLYLVLELGLAEDIDRSVRATIDDALPILAAGAPLAAGALVLRTYAIAQQVLWPLVGLTLVGASGIALAAAVDGSLASLCVGYVLSPLPWALGIPLLRRATGSFASR